MDRIRRGNAVTQPHRGVGGPIGMGGPDSGPSTLVRQAVVAEAEVLPEERSMDLKNSKSLIIAGVVLAAAAVAAAAGLPPGFLLILLVCPLMMALMMMGMGGMGRRQGGTDDQSAEPKDRTSHEA